MRTYRADRSAADSRRLRPEIMITAIVITLGIGMFAFIVQDLRRNPDLIDDSNNEAILGEFKSNIERFATVETEYFTVDVPESWVRVNDPEKIINRIRYYPVRYQGVDKGDVGKSLEIYRNSLPELKLDRALDILANGSKVTVGSISPRCLGFTENIKDYPGGGSPATWNNSNFICTLNSVTNVIGAFETKPSQGVFLKGDNTQGSYLFVYTDHSSSEDNSKFQRMLGTFKAK